MHHLWYTRRGVARRALLALAIGLLSSPSSAGDLVVCGELNRDLEGCLLLELCSGPFYDLTDFGSFEEGDWIYVEGFWESGDPDCGDGICMVGCIGVERIGRSPDLTRDCVVAFDDVLALLKRWGPCSRCPEDLDDSGTVDFADLLIVLAAWGPCE